MTTTVNSEISGGGGGITLDSSGNIVSNSGELFALSEVSDYVTLTASGIAFTGPCTLYGWQCSVAAGNITVYDALSATGTAWVPTEALVAGSRPIKGAGTDGGINFATGVYVTLSGAATVRVWVTGRP